MQFRDQKSVGPIGIHVRHHVLYGVQFRRVDGNVQLVARGSQLLEGAPSEPGVLLKGLAELLVHHPFRGKRAVSALPPSDVEVRPLRMPPGIAPDSAGFQAAFLAEVKSSLLYDPREAVLDYLPFLAPPDQDQRHSVLLISSKRERVNRFLAAFREAGLMCEHLEVSSCAAARALNRPSSVYAMVDIDAEHMVVSIASGVRMLFSRTVKMGYRAWTKRLQEALGVSEGIVLDLLSTYGLNPEGEAALDLNEAVETGHLAAGTIPVTIYEICRGPLEDLVKEVRRTLDYFALLPGGGRVDEVTVFGEALPRHLEGLLQQRLKMDAHIVSPAPIARECPELEARATARWTVAAGLAMREN